MKKDDTAGGLLFNIQKFSIHDGPGIRTTVFFKGCPLGCKWCSNPESQNPRPQFLGDKIDSRFYSLEEVVTICLQDRDFYEESCGGITLSGGEPFSQPEFLLELLKALGSHGLHRAIETAGLVPTPLFIEGSGLADLVLFDVKHYDSAKHQKGTGADNSLILANLKQSFEAGIQILPRIPVIPGFNAALEDAREFSELLRNIGIHRVQLLPFHQFGDIKYDQLNMDYSMRGLKPIYPEELGEYRNIFEDNGIDAFF